MTSDSHPSVPPVWLDRNHYLEPDGRDRRWCDFGHTTVIDTAGRAWRIRRSQPSRMFVLAVIAVAVIFALAVFALI